jgi:Glycosyl transferase family 90
MLENIPAADVPWRDKKNAAIWRGALTGINRNGTRNMQDLVTSSSTIDANQTAVCLTLQRCKLVYEHASSHLVNASLTSVVAYHPNNRFRTSFLPYVLEDGVHLVGPHLSYTDLLQYKALIMLEGNDISSGLKWALYSNSVVLMQRVTYTSWAMEELLEPWVHYIPLADDLSDVEEKVQWVLDHDEKSQQIAHSGSLWISDLVYHPDAFGDEERIIDESIHRYKQHFVLNPTLYENHVLSL